MSDVLCIEECWLSAPWLGLQALWKDTHHNNRKAQQMPRRRVSSLLPDYVALPVKALLVRLGLLFISLFSRQDLRISFCMQLCFSLGFITSRLKITSVISMLSRNYLKLPVCVIHQEGQASTLGKSGRWNHLPGVDDPGGPSKFSVKLVFLHYMHCQNLWKNYYFLKREVFLSSKYLFGYSSCVTK